MNNRIDSFLLTTFCLIPSETGGKAPEISPIVMLFYFHKDHI